MTLEGTQEAPAPRSNRSTRTMLVGAAVVIVVLGGIVAVVTATRGNNTAADGLADAPSELVPTGNLQSRPDPTDAFPLPDATLDGFAGGDPVATADVTGEPLVVNFWASWCDPCVREMPDLQQVASEVEGKVAFLGIDVMDAPAPAEEFAADVGVTYPLAVDIRGEYWKSTRSFGMPTTLFVQPDGTVVYRHTGPLSAATLRSMLSEHLGVEV